MSQYKFHAEIKEAPRGGAWVEIPFDVSEAFGTRGRVKVKASFDGYPYRGSIVPMGGVHVLGVKKAIRVAIGKSVGDTVHVILEQDVEPRVVDVPEELAEALGANPEASAFFNTLAYTYRKEYAEWIAGAIGKLYRKRTHTTTRTIDQNLLSWLNLSYIAKTMQGRKPGHRYGRRLLKRQVGRFQLHEIFRDTYVLAKGDEHRLAGRLSVDFAEYLVTWAKPRHVFANRFNLPCQIGTRTVDFWSVSRELTRACLVHVQQRHVKNSPHRF